MHEYDNIERNGKYIRVHVMKDGQLGIYNYSDKWIGMLF